MDAIELRMGDLRRYIITMIDEHSDYALALAVPSLNSDITSHFFSKATKLFPVAIRQVVTDNGKEFLGNFDKTLQEASIKHIWTYPYTPKMNATCERFNRTLREQFIEFNELLLFEDLNLFNQRMAEYLVLYNSKRPHKSLELMTPVDYILRESKNCNMWWTHTLLNQRVRIALEEKGGQGWLNGDRGEFMARYPGVRHRPDGIITLDSGAIVAVETERSMKTRARYINIINSHLAASDAGHWHYAMYVMPDDKTKTSLIRLFDSIKTVMRNNVPVPFDTRNREMFLFRTIDELEQATASGRSKTC